ncbi:prefoldin subunit 6 [Gigaspora margarita]|uniref:Prefoldin subunit 6 n=1 Tax=Gigaspora margarita TaxID=4874 RepID=A0A8H4ARY2_GIGMA|nr:prefoldin subunit 6 [Gigaspora margarita]
MSLEARLEAATTEYQKLQKDITNAVENLQKLDSQLQENEIVQKEFSLLKDDSNIYKLVGPVLVKQDKAEATENVARRLEHIQSDIKRMEDQVKDLTEKFEKKKVEIVQLNASRAQQTAS